MQRKMGSFINLMMVVSLVLAALAAGPSGRAVAQGAQPPGNPGGVVFLSGAKQGQPLEIALAYIQDHKGDLNLTAADLSDYAVTDQYTSKHNGVTHIYLRQRYQGIEVSSANININVARNGSIINLGNAFVPDLAKAVNRTAPLTTRTEAVQAAASSLGLKMARSPLIVEAKGGPAREVVFAPDAISMSPIPVKLVYHVVSPGVARLAWNLQIQEPSGNHYWSIDLDAEDNQVLGQIDFVSHDRWGAADESDAELAGSPYTSVAPATWADEFADFKALGSGASARPASNARIAAPYHGVYRVFAFPIESPLFGDRVLVSPEDPLASPFGWHDWDGVFGPEFTQTRGNNVRAYLDRDANNAYNPGESPDGGASLIFDFPLDLSTGPEIYTASAVTNLFYLNNAIHDVFYLYGFDEAAGNFQVNNYGRGGAGFDYVIAHAQDGAGVNNAQFGTPADGYLPLMQMYLWRDPAMTLTVTSPGSIAGNYEAAGSGFGLQAFDVTAVATTTVPADGCSAINDVTGKIAVIDRGNCSYIDKVRNAQNAGAVGVIVVTYAGQPVSSMSCTANCDGITIGSGIVSYTDGQIFKDPANQPVTMRMYKDPRPDRDGDYDNGVVIHEYGHGLSNRLVGGPNTVSCLNNNEQPGEGWSDFVGLALTARNSTTRTRALANYDEYQPMDGPGIRPTPYSQDMGINPSTYGDIPGLVVPHGVGYVFGSMLWEVYWNLVDKYGFNPDIYGDWTTGGNNLAMQLVLDGMKLAPCSPGFVDSRNAIIAADIVLTGGENYCEIWQGFAKRGLGYSAQQGSAFDSTDGTEAFDLPAACSAPQAQVSPASLTSTQRKNAVVDKPLDIKNANSSSGPNTQATTTETVPQDIATTTIMTATVYQDDQNDPTTASFTTTVVVTQTMFLDVFTSNVSDPNADVDLYVYDSGGALVGTSGTSGSDEYVLLAMPADDTYTIALHGWGIPTPPVTIDLTVKAMPIAGSGGTAGYFEKTVTVTDTVLLNIDTSAAANGSNIDLYVLDPTHRLAGSSTSATDVERVRVAMPANGDYTIIVRGTNLPAADTFTLNVQKISGLGSYLHWSISEAPTDCASPADLPWVSVSPASGAAAPGLYSNPQVAFNSLGLAPGTYTGKLCLTNTAPATPALIEVPLTLEVLPTLYFPFIHK